MYQIAQRMESVGGYLNAFTSKEYTCFYARALDEHLGRAIDTICDLVMGPLFPEKELEKEKDVVLEEMKMYEDTPEDIIFDVFESLVYNDHSLGRPVIGKPESVTSFSRTDLLHFLHAHYTPDRIVVSVAGNVDLEQVVSITEKAVGSLERKKKQYRRAPINGYMPGHRQEERSTQQAHIVLGTRGLSIRDDKRVVLSVLNTILGGGMSSRLNQNIREKYGYCYNIYSFSNMHTDAGDFGVYMGTDAGKIDRSKKLVQRELDKLMQKKVSLRVLNQAKNQVKGSVMLGLESMSNRMMRLGRQELFFNRYFTLDEVNTLIDDVTADDVMDVAQKVCMPDQVSSVVFLPKD